MTYRHDFSSRLQNTLSLHGVDKLYRNINTDISYYDISGHRILATTTFEVTDGNCYVVSPYAMIINYSKEELYKVKQKILLPVAYLLIYVFDIILRLVKIDRVHILNNFMLSTNFFESYWDSFDLKILTKTASTKHPIATLAIRSLNMAQNSTIISNLEKEGWLPIVTRQVYLFKDFDMNKRDIIRDLKLLESTRYIFTDPDIRTLQDFEHAEQLYNQLYLKKYTKENIQYTALFMKELYKAGDLHLKLLRDTEQNRTIGVVGIIGNDTTLTAPIVGYDLSMPAEEALYRRCLIYIISFAHQQQKMLNLSSGAPDFKINRGGKPAIEFMYVYTRHLGHVTRVIWWILSKISLHFYKPILIREKL